MFCLSVCYVSTLVRVLWTVCYVSVSCTVLYVLCLIVCYVSVLCTVLYVFCSLFATLLSRALFGMCSVVRFFVTLVCHALF